MYIEKACFVRDQSVGKSWMQGFCVVSMCLYTKKRDMRCVVVHNLQSHSVCYYLKIQHQAIKVSTQYLISSIFLSQTDNPKKTSFIK